MPRGHYERPAKPEEGEKPDTLELSVRLMSGKFETSLRVPFVVGETEASVKHTVDRWLKMIETCIQQGVSDMSLAFGDEKPPMEGTKP